MKKEFKIRKILGNKYHLSTEYGGENCEITKWVLFKRYENADPIYWSADNKPIMSSDTHTLDDLYEYAKKHKKINFELFYTRLRVYFAFIIVIVAMANIFINSRTLRTIILTSDVIIIISSIIQFVVVNKNHKVDMLETEENYKRFKDNLKKDKESL